ncbi:MAG: recombinase family protein [Firmicutes bacterium]|nr:recombinase family protein [Bacillota bacterium]
MKKQQIKKAALYCRLSRDDEYMGESMSIQSQKTMLAQYAKSNGFCEYEFYADDGYTGTNFNRPDFQRMIEDIENGQISTVIVKDLSRLGREYLQTGYYTEIFFPDNDIRFIAINDNVDSDCGENEFTPFKNIINEWYAKDTSRKVRSAIRARAKNGEYTGSRPAFGYTKEKDNCHRLIPDENTAHIVKTMFQMALEGTRCYDIAQYLKKHGIPTPRAYTDRTKTNHFVDSTKYPCDWSKTSVYQILSNPIYTGNLVQCRKRVKSFKNKKLIFTDPSEWITAENTHEALVSQEVFDLVQDRISVKKPKYPLNPNNIYRGLMVCGECGNKMVWQHDKRKSHIGYYSCNLYKRYGGEECTFHHIRVETLNEIVLESIKSNAALAAADEEKYIQYLVSQAEMKFSVENAANEKEVAKIKKRIEEIDKLILKIYEDNAFGRISDERFTSLSESLETEQKELKQRLTEIAAYKRKMNNKAVECGQYANLIKEYTDITELTAEVLNQLIEKIVIHEYINDGERLKEVEIYYRFVGHI